MKQHHLLRALFGTLTLAYFLVPAGSGPVHATEWQVELEVSNGASVRDTITFGVHPDGTPGVDSELGEVGLPPWPPSSLFEVRFLAPGCEGLKLDLRDTTHTQRFHTIKWQAGSGGYPVTVRWDRATLPYASLYISDGYGGVFIPPVNMYAVDSLQVPPSMSYIIQLTLDVTPGANPNAYPEIGNIPNATIYLDQQYPEYNLDDYVFDPDTPDYLIEWIVTDNQALIFEIDENRVLRITAPTGWTGAEMVTFTARDPEMHTDQTEATFSVISGGLPNWTIPLTVKNGAEESCVVHFGIHPDGSDGIDTELGEVSLPPWPPSDAFDVRFQLPDLVTWSVLDIRESLPDTISYHLKWQSGDGGYPVTVEWPPNLPLGDFTMQDDMGGVFIPPVSMADTTQIEVADTFVTGLTISALAVVDTTPPVGPEWLVSTGWIPGVSVDLKWPKCIEEHFAYYEILYDTVDFFTEADFVWDWTEDVTLMNIETISTTVLLPVGADSCRFRIRAWDIFGNVSPLSNIVVTGLSENERGNPPPSLVLHAWPNPFHNKIVLWYFAPGDRDAALSIYDAAGRLVERFTVKLSSDYSGHVLWSGRDMNGTTVSSGVYFCKLETTRGYISKKLIFLK